MSTIEYEGKTYTKITPQDIDRDMNRYLDTKNDCNVLRDRYNALWHNVISVGMRKVEGK